MDGHIPRKSTVFRNIVYRSRLEARWAVFLTSLEINFVYEGLKFVKPNSEITYTPDFVIPNTKIPFLLLEVKPTYPTADYLKYIIDMVGREDMYKLNITIGDFFNGNIPQVYLPTDNKFTTITNFIHKVFGIHKKEMKKHLKIAETFRFDI